MCKCKDEDVVFRIRLVLMFKSESLLEFQNLMDVIKTAKP